MTIRIPSKFGLKVKPDNKPRLSISERLKARSKKYNDDCTNIKPHLGNLFQYYRHDCTIFLPDKNLGRFGVMVYCCRTDYYDRDLFEKYEQVGQILAQI
ncbi:hypothetical protein M595_1224 [Lyngbya aestuarii BL J]|uniref:Uncharacterized protein n=1 Tax=Lyngbya aestuarii BL J TaxID=1348334 RepID=U7QL69_9CYAN|nr:hypothetical protein [Lyngbya aestuarii]ERT08709.1 hypothetical protein M595_1224 [Lyngbya aestuarii BL J]